MGGKKDPEAVEREREKQKKKARRVKAQAYKAAAPERERAAELARLSGLEAAPAGADDEDVEYVPAQLAVGDDPAVQAFAEVFEKFKVEAPAAASEEVKEEKEPKKAKAKANLLDDDSDESDDADDGPRKMSKRKKKETQRMTIAMLKQSVSART